MDRGVAAGGDADAVALLDQVQDQVGAGVGLARARRALDEQVAVVQALRDLLGVLQVEGARLQRLAARARRCARNFSSQDLAQRAVATRSVEPARDDVLREPTQSGALVVGCHTACQGSARGEGARRHGWPHGVIRSVPVVLSIDSTVTLFSVAGSTKWPGAILCSCGGKLSVWISEREGGGSGIGSTLGNA